MVLNAILLICVAQIFFVDWCLKVKGNHFAGVRLVVDCLQAIFLGEGSQAIFMVGRPQTDLWKTGKFFIHFIGL